MEKSASKDFETVEGVDICVLVCRKEDVVDVQDESLKSFVAVFVRKPGFGVDQGVLVAKIVVNSSCKMRFQV